MSLLSVRHINSGYGKKQVLFDVSFDIEKGETVLLIGSNGSGKSTLFKNIYQILPLWKNEEGSIGHILYDGKDITNTPTHELIKLGIMYIPQKNELYEDMTVEENLIMSVLHFGKKKLNKEYMKEVFEQIPTLAMHAKQQANQLSGGERKMLSLAMVLMNKPKLVLYDEPLAGLSDENISVFVKLLREINQIGTSFAFIEHRVAELVYFADKTIGLKLGKLSTRRLTNVNDIKSFLI